MKCLNPHCSHQGHKSRGYFCSKQCRDIVKKQEQADFLNDLPPNINIHQDGNLLVIGARPTREDIINEM